MKSSTLTLIHDIISFAADKGIVQLSTEDEYYDGRNITIDKKKLINFGSCSYLGLELDERLKKGAIDAIERFGIQFSSSRTYISCSLYEELNSLLRKLFNAPALLSTSTSLGHHGVIPVIVDDNDAIIMDQQVHASVQDAAFKLQTRGIKVTIVRHNDLAELEKKVIELSATHSKIWYMIDGVYSMYGDFAPVHSIVELLNKHSKLHLYADDAHGMSWYGKNGKGYILSEVPGHPKIVVATSFAKAFGAGGGVFVFPDEEIYRKVKNCGGPFIFSGPHQMPVLGAAVASAKIHLTDEIYVKQEALSKRISYCHALLKQYNLPVISSPETPIFFIGLGLLRVGHNMVKRMINDGLYVNIAMFPAVPESCTGIRFTITLHHTMEDIERLAKALAYHLPKALAEEERSIYDIHRAFKRVASFNTENIPEVFLQERKEKKYTLTREKTIQNISKELWNSLMAERGNFDWDNLSVMESVFSKNAEREYNWNFHYYIITDENKTPLLATFFTTTLAKDDMLAPESVSASIEKIREKDHYFLTSKSMMMGSMITEGEHLYIDRNHPDWKKILMMMVDAAWKEQDKNGASVILMRDFDSKDPEINNFFREQGFISFDLPDAHLVKENRWETREDFMQRFKHDKRYYLRKRVFANEDHFEVKISSHLSEKEIGNFYKLYKNIAKKNLEINVFILPEKLFREMALSGYYEFISLYLKEEFDHREERLPVGMAINYIAKGLYCFMLTGLDYNLSEQHNVYPQILWQIVKRANELNIPDITLGYTASQNKRKLGASAVSRTAFIQMKDNFNMNLIEIMTKTSVTVQ